MQPSSFSTTAISPLLPTNLPGRRLFQAIMPTHRPQQRNQGDPGSGEDFSDVSSTVDTDDESVAQTQDTWTFPVLSSKPKREEYETASKFPQCLSQNYIDEV